MGAWWISWIDFPFSCRKIYILLTCYVTVTEASKQVKCTVTMNLSFVYFLSQENYENPRLRMEPRPEWCWVLIGGLDLGYDWAGQAPPAAPVIVDPIRPGPVRHSNTDHPDTSHFPPHITGDQMLHPQGRALAAELRLVCPLAEVSLLLALAPTPGMVLTDAESDLYLVLAVTK